MLSSLDKLIDVYNPANVVPVVFSATLYFLYMIITLMETSFTIKENGIGSEVVRRVKFILSYTFGQFIYFLKITAYLLTLYLLVTIIRILIVVIFNVFMPSGAQRGGGSYREMVGGFELDMAKIVKDAMVNNAVWILGYYVLENFSRTMLVVLPLFVLFNAIVTGIGFYNPGRIEQYDNTVKIQILNTAHHEMFFSQTCFIVISSIYLMVLYYYAIKSTGGEEA